MAQIYLDIDSIVRVDLTPQGQRAQDAKADQLALRFLDACETLAASTTERHRQRGRDVSSSLNSLERVTELRRQVLADAEDRLAYP